MLNAIALGFVLIALGYSVAIWRKLHAYEIGWLVFALLFSSAIRLWALLREIYDWRVNTYTVMGLTIGAYCSIAIGLYGVYKVICRIQDKEKDPCE